MLVTVLWTVLGLVLLVGGLALLRANRLDRLHAKADGTASALRSALDHRARAALGLDAVVDAAVAALRAGPDEREAAENELTARIAALDEVPAELHDAQDRVVMARRVHNDAVRDALALRGTKLARWLSLTGVVPAPRYFEITESGRAEAPAAEPQRRDTARVVLLDEADRVLLFEGADPARPQEPFWFTVGGAVEPGERPQATALRELAEETGLRLSEDELTGPVWQRDVLFSFDGQPYTSRDLFFVARTSGLRVDTTGFNDVEQRTVLGHRWWSAAELRATNAVVYPEQLAELLPTVADEWNGRTVSVR